MIYQKQTTMKISKTNTKLAGSITAEALTGELFTMIQDDSGVYGFTSNKGYNSWEGSGYSILTKALVSMYGVIDNINKEFLLTNPND